jgi:hypothetical protein
VPETAAVEPSGLFLRSRLANADNALSSNSAYASASLGATVIVAEPTLSRGLLGTAGTFETRSVLRPAVEPLQQITPPSERARARLLTAMVTMASSGIPTRTGERAATRLSEENLYDNSRRFDAHGAGVSMKF